MFRIYSIAEKLNENRLVANNQFQFVWLNFLHMTVFLSEIWRNDRHALSAVNGSTLH
jgi:hypothetical protein